MVEKRRIEEKTDSNDSGSDTSMKEDELVDVDFDFFDPKEIDFHGIKNLLKQLFSNDHERIDLSGFSNVIVNQGSIGTSVKVDGDSDPYALMTVVNLKQHEELEFVKQIKVYLMERIKKQPAEKQQKLKDAFEKKQIAFLVNERLVNMPVEIVPPMFKMLQEEIEWAVEDVSFFIAFMRWLRHINPSISYSKYFLSTFFDAIRR